MPKQLELSNLSQATPIHSMATVRNRVGRSNQVDLFSFKVSDRANLRLNFRSSGQPARIALAQDRNQNQKIELDEVLQSARMRSNQAGVLKLANLKTGNYFIQVQSQGKGTTNYRLQYQLPITSKNLIRQEQSQNNLQNNPNNHIQNNGQQPEAANTELQSMINEIVTLTNQYRQQHGLPPVRLNSKLNLAAQRHSEDMAVRDYFDHRSPENLRVGDRLSAVGYRWSNYAENLAAGYRSPAAVVQGWIDSPGHQANLLKPGVQEIGVGYFFLENDPGTVQFNTYWTQNFGTELI